MSILLETPAGVQERLAIVRLASKTFPGNGHSVPPSSMKGKFSRLQNTKYLSKYIQKCSSYCSVAVIKKETVLNGTSGMLRTVDLTL